MIFYNTEIFYCEFHQYSKPGTSQIRPLLPFSSLKYPAPLTSPLIKSHIIFFLHKYLFFLRSSACNSTFLAMARMTHPQLPEASRNYTPVIHLRRPPCIIRGHHRGASSGGQLQKSASDSWLPTMQQRRWAHLT